MPPMAASTWLGLARALTLTWLGLARALTLTWLGLARALTLTLTLTLPLPLTLTLTLPPSAASTLQSSVEPQRPVECSHTHLDRSTRRASG